jgi:plasmid rolling circle replication initiator protein Rep
MAKTEQIVTDRKTMKELVGFMEEALREGLTKEEVTSQIDLMLDDVAKRRLERSLKEARDGKILHFKNKDELLNALHKTH